MAGAGQGPDADPDRRPTSCTCQCRWPISRASLRSTFPRKSGHRVIRILPLPVPVLLSTPFVLPILLNLAERAMHYLSPLPVFSVTAPLVPDGNWGTRNSSHNNIRARPL